MEDCITTLGTLDDILIDLRAELKRIRPPESTSTTSMSVRQHTKAGRTERSGKKQDYAALRSELNLSKVKRLVTARENAIKSVKGSINRARAEQAATKDPPVDS